MRPPSRPALCLLGSIRSYRNRAASSSGSHLPTLQVFDRAAKRLQRQRAASDAGAGRTVDYVKDLVADNIAERLLLINRSFPHVLDLGAGACHIAKALVKPREGFSASGETEAASSRVSHIVAGELSEELLYRDADLPYNEEISIERRVLDEEMLPFGDNAFDAVVSAGSMHWINDLPSTLTQVNRVLKPDGPFVAGMFGGDTLYELRTSLQLAELDRLGGVSPRVSPLADTKDLGSLLDRAGFRLLTIDVDDIVVDYPDSFALMQDLQAMAESNAVIGRLQGPIPRDVLMAANSIYRELHGNEDGSLPATFRVIYMIGWKQSENQPKPLERGTGRISMKHALGGGSNSV